MRALLSRKKWLPGLSQAIVDKPWRFIIASLILIGVFAPPIINLKSDYSVRIWFRTTDPLIKDLNALEQKFGNDEKVIIAVHSKSGIFQPRIIKIIQELTETVWQIPDVIRADSLSNFQYSTADGDEINTSSFLDPEETFTQEELERKKEIALTDPMIKNQFISKDGKTTLVFGSLRPDITGSPDYQFIVSKIKMMMEPFEKEYKDDVTFHYGGAASINDAYREVSEDDLKVMIPINMLIMMVLLFYIFRSFIGVFFPIALVAITVTMTMGLSALIDYPFDNLSSAIPGILIAICMADTVHIFSTYYRRLLEGADKKQATYDTVYKNFIPTFLTSFSTMIGFLSLTQTELVPVRHLGFLAGMGTFMAWILTIFLVCPLLPMLPSGKINMKKKVSVSKNFSLRYYDFLYAHKGKIITLVSVFAVLSFVVGMLNKVNSDPLKHFSERLKISQDSRFLLDTFNGVGGPQIVVDSGSENGAKDPMLLKKVETFINELEKDEVVNKVTSINGVIKQLNMKLHEDRPEYYRIPDTQENVAEILLLYSFGLPQGMDLNNQISLDNRFLRLGVMWNIHDASRSLDRIDRYYKLAEKIGLNIVITGKLVLYHRMVGYIVSTFFKSISVALILITTLLFFVLGSWKLAALSLLPNIVPLTFGAGVMTLIGTPVDIGTSLVISVCLGIAVDDTIHFLSHYRDLVHSGMDTKEAIRGVMEQTSTALLFTTVILTLAFGVFMFANFLPNVNFGILCSIILTMALLIDLVYLPAILIKFKIKV